MTGKLPLSHGNLPESTIAPPIDVPCPPRYLVAEWITTSAPKSKGRHRYGDASVESTTSGTPASWATTANASKSATVPAGFATISVYKSLVEGRTAAANAPTSSGGTKV